MKAPSKAVYSTFFLLILFVAGLVTYSTARGYTDWWLTANGHVEVDGVSSGYLHEDWSHSSVLITRTDLKPHQSYLVHLSTTKSLAYCGDWHAPRMPLFPIGDLNPPCLGFDRDDDAKTQRGDFPISSTLLVKDRLVEFSTMQGRKVTASW